MNTERYFYVVTSNRSFNISGNGYVFIETNGSYPYFKDIQKSQADRHAELNPDNIVILSVIEFNSYQDFIDARDGTDYDRKNIDID